jgi:hypothetical protein
MNTVKYWDKNALYFYCLKPNKYIKLNCVKYWNNTMKVLFQPLW